MTSRERVLSALSHREPDRVPMDFGSTGVTGVHVSCIAALRDHYGLEKRMVKVHEPYQMLGIIDEDLRQAMGLDVEGTGHPATLFGYRNRDWKPWRMPDGLEVLVSEEFRVTSDANGDILIYPQGDMTVPPSGRMPRDGWFFDTIVRQPPLVEEALDPADNLEEFTPISDGDLEQMRRDAREARLTGRAVIVNIGGTGFGDIALVTAPFLKHPKGIRDIAEWYVSTAGRKDYVHQVFSGQSEIALENLRRVHESFGDAIDAIFLCGADFGTQTSSFCSVKTLRELYCPYYAKLNDWIHAHTSVEDVQAFLRIG